MSLLLIQLPPRDRLAAQTAPAGTADGSATRPPPEWTYVLSADGRSVARTGHAAAALLPPADEVVLVLDAADVSWHRVAVPKAPGGKLRAALGGVMEEALLDDDEALHLALGADAAPGREGWVAVTHRPYLVAAIDALESAGLSVRRVAPGIEPGPARAHFFLAPGDDHDGTPWLALSGADGAGCLKLAGGLARALLPAGKDATPRLSATPAAAAAAERWLGAPLPLMSEADRLLEAAQGRTNLRQFELVARTRGTRQVAELGRRMLGRDWRAVRIGLAVLVGVQLLGLNAYAWQQRQALAARRDAQASLLRSAHPGVQVVLDAPLQMERENERLRAAAGRLGDGDLETLLGAAAMAWPDAQPPVQALRFEAGRLSLSATGWGEPQVQQFRERLRSGGFVVEFGDGRVSLTRGNRKARS